MFRLPFRVRCGFESGDNGVLGGQKGGDEEVGVCCFGVVGGGEDCGDGAGDLGGGCGVVGFVSGTGY